jgi:transposase
LDNYPINSNSLEKHYHINGNHFGQQYKDHLSDYQSWDQKDHAKDWLLFPSNIGVHLSIDETALTNGELYTIITNKSGKGRKGSLVAIIEGTKADKIIDVLNKISKKERDTVEEVTLDMANSMHKIVRKCFTKATLVIDRFHVQKLAYDALQEMRIDHRWDAINEETNARENAKADDKKYIPKELENGDTKKQLLARSRYLLFKSGDKWTEKQGNRAKVLFELYPDIKLAYSLTHSLRMIFTKNTDKSVARTKMAKWFEDVTNSEFKSFNTISATFYSHYPEILNFYDNRSTNASAESFNAKLKAFRASLRGVVDIEFFLFRVAKIYA